MPRSTTRAGFSPRLFTSKITAQPRTPDSYGFLSDGSALRGIWIVPVIHLGPRDGGTAAETQQNFRQSKARSAVCDGAIWRRCPTDQLHEFRDKQTWA